MGRRLQYGEEKRRTSPRPDLIENVMEQRAACDSVSEKSMELSSPEEQTLEIPHMPGQINADELYAVPVKRRERPWKADQPAEQKPLLGAPEDEDETEETLPPGWEKHEGDNNFLV